jgi:hypothetical protein
MEKNRSPCRAPSEKLKLHLRREVNYGCPVWTSREDGCGCPILTYHHFDPPWAGNELHDPDGMIALCPIHHEAADGGAWNKAQLRAFKRHPFVDSAVKVRWPWKAERLVVKCGRNLVLGTGSPIRLNGNPVLFVRPQVIECLGTKMATFDSRILDANLRPWLEVHDGSLDVQIQHVRDIEFPPQQREFTVIHRDSTMLRLRFRRIPSNELKTWIQRFMTGEMVQSAIGSIEKLGCIDSEGIVPVLTVEGDFKSKECSIRVRGHRMSAEMAIPGFSKEKIEDMGEHVVDAERRMILEHHNGGEILSIG